MSQEKSFLDQFKEFEEYLAGILKYKADKTADNTITADTFYGNVEGNVKGDLTGNADTATKLATARTISISNHATASGTFDGSSDLTLSLTLADSGVSANSYGPSSNSTLTFGGTYTIPQVTVDRYGRVTSVTARTMTMPSGGTMSSALTINAACSATSFQATSDKRLKENIEPATCFSVNDLHPWLFNFKGSEEKHIGLIAQNVQDIIPWAVKQNENGYLEIEYNAIVAVLCEEVNKLKKEINDLKTHLG